MKITLWGHRAAAFTTNGVYNRSEATPVTVLFVGGLMKSYQGTILASVLLWVHSVIHIRARLVPKKFGFCPSHRIFGRMHGALNIYEKN